ncbi:MAG: TonB-dependent receptor [Ignavibacteriaceae bacterium]|nr:TonB-dependent receptor [Ignavibacteriaceae bacterium]
MLKYFCLLWITIGFLSFPQSNIGTLTGTITDEKGTPLPYANILLKETNNGTIADNHGKYKIVSRPGVYNVQVSYIGFEKILLQIELQANRTTEKTFILKSTSFEIGTIIVTAQSDFIPTTPETKTTVSASEIEHIQASSLNDVMKLTPGVETTNPTLNNVEKAQIRSGDALGTQIILDGIPISNNANMQIGIGQSSANSGIDLRSIPAENIKEVEIIRGIPSVQYGDLTDGLLLVKTSAIAETPKAKIKYNPQLYEMNLSSGFTLIDWVLNGNFNVASSERDIRVQGDGYTRIAAQLSIEKDDEDFNLKNIIYLTRAFDEYKEKPGYALREAWYNRDLNLKYTGDFSKFFNSFNKLSAKLSISYTRQNSYSQQLVSRDNIVISNRLDEGTQEGRIVFGSYLGKKNINGDVWNLYSDINYNYKFFTGDYLHGWMAGITYRNDFNKGEGIIFDPLFPPSVSITTPRLRSYNDIPDYSILSFYSEDKITGVFFRPFTLQFGFRYEVYRPDGINLKGLIGKGDLIESRNGSFLNPRITFSMNLTKDTQIRLGYGVTSKSPPLGMIFAQPKYYDIIDTVSVVNPQYPDSNFSLVSTFIRQQANENIKGYTQRKYEISVDQQFDFFGFSITGYINKTTGMFQSFNEPTLYYKRTYPNWPDQSNNFISRTYLDTYAQYSNNGWMTVQGIEASLTTKQIPVLNTVLKIDGAYIYEENGTSSGYYFSSPRNVSSLNAEVMPMYTSTENYSKDLLINYRFEIQARSLGIWFTIHLQQKLIEISGRRRYEDTLAIGYYSASEGVVLIPVNERMDPKYSAIERTIQPYDLFEEDKPNKWLFNLKVSKSLWKGAAISFYVNNFLNNRPLYQSKRSPPSSPIYERRNPDIFYGIDLSTTFNFLR